MNQKYHMNDNNNVNPFLGKLLHSAIMSISKIVLVIVMMILIHNCSNTTSINNNINNKRTFIYLNKLAKDTIKFYGYDNLDTALCYAKKEKKNILMIFSCYACMSENGKEWQTLTLFANKDKIQENFIIAWLPVDDKRPASDTNQVVFWYGKNCKLLDLGDKYKYFEETIFKQSTQPLFCFIDTLQSPYGKILSYSNNKKEVEDFVYSGIINH